LPVLPALTNADHRSGDFVPPPEPVCASGVSPEWRYGGVTDLNSRFFKRQDIFLVWLKWRLTEVSGLWKITLGPDRYKHAYADDECCVKNREARGHGTPSDLRPPWLRL